MKVTDINAALDPQFVKVDTPRTDALHFGYKDGIDMQRLELLKLSRTLERELAEAKAEIVRECIAQVRKDENGPAYEAAGRIAEHFGIE